MSSLSRIVVVAVLLSGPLGVAAFAADDPGQKPPAEQKPASRKECVVDSGDFAMRGKTPIYVITIENKCEQRLRCKVYVNVMSAKGSAEGHATLTLAPHSQGAKAKQSYVLKVKMMGGIAQASRECKVL